MLRSRSKAFYTGSAALALASAAVLYQLKSDHSVVLNDSPENELKKPRKPKAPVLPTSSLATDYPGVYAWGSNVGNVIAPGFGKTFPAIKTPYRIPYFDGRLLRDLSIGENVGVAVLDNGDVVQWGDGYATGSEPEVTVKGRNISKVQVAEGRAVYGLTKNGSSVYAWSVSRDKLVNGPKLDSKCNNSGSWWKIWTWGRSGGNTTTSQGTCLNLKLPSLGFREYVKDIQVGNDHILVLTSKGRVFSGSTGLYPEDQPKASKGQFGIASFSQFDKAPLPGQVYEIKSFRDSIIAQIATGDFHSLARTKDGKVYVFGDNLLGQLGLPYSYSTSNIAVPTLLPLYKMYPRRLTPIVTHIAAGGDSTFVTVHPKFNPHEIVDRSQQLKPEELNREIYGFGSSLYGQLGTGGFVHAQSSPARIKTFANLTEYNEKLGKIVQIDLSNWSVSRTHAAVAAGSEERAALFGKDVLLWGGNEFSQLGTGKKNNIPKPSSVSDLNVPRGATVSESIDEKEDVWKKADATTKNDRLQLIQGKKVKYEDPDSHKSKSAKISQVLVTGNNSTAVFAKRA